MKVIGQSLLWLMHRFVPPAFASLLLVSAACSSEPPTQNYPEGSGGSSAGAMPTAGAAAAGAPSAGAAGTGTSGAGPGGAGGGDAGMAGSAVAGESGGGAGGSGGGTSGAGGSSSGACSNAPAGALPFDGHCYLFVSAPATFFAARDDCAGRGGHLVTITSQGGRSEEQFLAENAFVWQLGGMMEAWIAATDGIPSNQPGNGTFSTWINGEAMDRHRWSQGQPDNSQDACAMGGGDCWEHCGFLWNMGNPPGEWNDRICEHTLPYVCEWDSGG